ncbi:ABC transporter permease [Pedobacter frigiditerrae]|uniref:ABC transporter permease n=1 Tax=Pedobacter frigiditerrae TaxID=2530452 RepID=UPI0029317D38|nr:FtsX-like permease family protein [Pedobacter frigiditerrae]
MLKLNLKIAFRNIWKYKATNTIKLFGLVVGLSTVIVLISYVMYELSYDRENPNADRVYRIHLIDKAENTERSSSPLGFAQVLMENIPEIEHASRLQANPLEINVGRNEFPVELNMANLSYFDIFGIKIVQGNKSALSLPNTIAISEKLAKIFFPNKSAIGQFVTVKHPVPQQIVAVMQDLPEASHFKGNVFANIKEEEPFKWYGYRLSSEYILLKKGASIETVEQKLRSLSKQYQVPEHYRVKFMPVTKIHLYSHTDTEIETNSDVKYIYIFCTMAFFILFIALINFINLTVSASLKRGKEIGIKKVMGASVKQLRVQFLSESYIYFVVATFLAMVISYDLVPMFSDKLGIAIDLKTVFNIKSMLAVSALIILSGFLAGFYPAIILSRLMPVKTLKGNVNTSTSSFSLKKSLIVIQFAVSAFLIVCTLVIYSQLNFISNKKLGFDKDHVLMAESKKGFWQGYDDKYESFKNDLLRYKGIESISLSTFNLGESYREVSEWTDKKDSTKTVQTAMIFSDFDFIKTLNLELVKGRIFSNQYGVDRAKYSSSPEKGQSKEALEKSQLSRPIILNQTAETELKLAGQLNKTLNLPGLKGTIIGVVKDFNGMSLHSKVTPMALYVEPNSNAGHTYIKIDPLEIKSVKRAIETVWRKYFTIPAPEFSFLDDHLEKLYLEEMRLGSVFISFAGIAIILCCIGLFGMVYFDLEQRTKEIAVRKILGASAKDLLALLNSGFVKMIIIANIIVWPFAYYLIKEWLNGFYYRIELSYQPFLVGLLICLTLTILTVSIQAIKTLKKSPVDALKYE